MALEQKDNKHLISGVEAQTKLLEGAKASYDAVTHTYGPKGKNVLIEKTFGRPLLTRDGVTVAREVYFKDRAKNMGAQALMEASETTNRLAGDGTTATVALGYHLLKNGNQAIAAGKHPMEISEALKDDSYKLLDKLEEISTPVKKNQLEQVASVSSGDGNLGKLIAEAIEHVGPDGGIITEKSYVQGIEREYVDGYFLRPGFQALQAGKKELTDPLVIVAIRRLSSAADAIDVLTQTAKVKNLQPGNIPRFLFVGNIEEAAYNIIVDNINRGTIDAIILKTPPEFGNMGKELLEDVAIYAGCEPLSDATNLKDFKASYVGTVDRVVASKNDATLFADNKGEYVRERVGLIKEQIEAESVDAISEKLRDRVAKLDGKIALFKIGGATETAKEEVEFRVEDAIQATRAAYSHGVVPGGATTLLELSKGDISPYYRDALQETFKQLLVNANLNEQVKLNEILSAPGGMGYSLRESDELVDMVKAGILDPKLVVEQIIRNATSAATNLLTTGTIVIFEDKEV